MGRLPLCRRACLPREADRSRVAAGASLSGVAEPICTLCGSPRQPGNWRCNCGGLLDFPELPATALRRLPPIADGPGGLWRYGACIPVPAATAAPLSMGEGLTPVMGVGRSLPGVTLKLEFLSPTLSFKDRGAVVLIASAVERAARRLVADSSGNAGTAIAAYAARAGLECQVFVPEGASRAKRAQLEIYGASVERVAGDRTATMEGAMVAVQRTAATYASHVFDPFFVQGTKTFAFELWEQLDRVPDALVVPVGNGTLLLGAERGFRELRGAGLIDRVPALIAVQSDGCAPLARAWALGAEQPAEVEPRTTIAEGVAIPRPPRGAQILAAVALSGGCVVAAPEAAIAPAQRDLARRGLFVEPTAALTWAGALLARQDPALGAIGVEGEPWRRARELAAGSVVVPLCGAGLKSV
jgi:threonine synthase